MSWSDEVFAIFGLDTERPDSSFETFMERIHPDDRESVNDKIHAAIRSGSGVSLDYRIVRPDGTLRYVREQSRTITSDDGTAARRVGTIQDITDTRMAEQALRDSETRYAELFNTIGSGVAVYRAVDNGNDFVFADLNESGERLSKVSIDDIRGKRIFGGVPQRAENRAAGGPQAGLADGHPGNTPAGTVCRRSDHRMGGKPGVQTAGR